MKNLFSISAISFCFILFGCSCSTTQTHRFKTVNGKIPQNSIASLEKISIGGVDQWILIRGENVNNPILFKLHGGPGQAEMATVNYNHDLEKHFIVVEWDQRGAGKSYESINPKSAMTLNQLVEDTREISEYLLKRFNQNKLILVGHSWGSILGIMAVQKYPQLFKAFVSTGQIVNMAEGVKISYKHLIGIAKSENNDQALTELTAIGEPPFNNEQTEK